MPGPLNEGRAFSHLLYFRVAWVGRRVRNLRQDRLKLLAAASRHALAKIRRRLFIAQRFVKARRPPRCQRDYFSVPRRRPSLECFHHPPPESLPPEPFADHDLLHPGHAAIGEERHMVETENVARDFPACLRHGEKGIRLGQQFGKGALKRRLLHHKRCREGAG